MSEPTPTERSRTAKVALAVVAGALGTAIIGGALWAVWEARRPEPAEQTEIEPAEKTEEPTTTPSAGTTDTGSSGATTTPGGSASGGSGGANGGGASAPMLSRKVAYRLGSRLFVADEDGSDPVDVAPAASTYALSPDGKSLALIMDPPRSTGRVLVYEVAVSGSLRMGGTGAYPGWLSWSPDGRYIAYSAGTLEDSTIREMRRDGSGDGALVDSGGLARFSPDGMALAYRPSGPPDSGAQLRLVQFASSAYPKGILAAASALSFGFAPNGDLYFTRPGKGTAWEVWRSKAPYSDSQKVGSVNMQAPAYALSDLFVSPDGRYLVTGATGDDEYCRVWVLRVSDGRSMQLSTRRDATPSGWTSDGRVLYFEGNTYQGEASSLMSAKPDGTSRRVVVEGAAL